MPNGQLPKIHDVHVRPHHCWPEMTSWEDFYGFIGFLSLTIQINRYQQHPVACLCFASWLSVELSCWVGSKRPRCARAQIIWHGLWLRITNKKHWLMTPGFVNGLITGKEGNHLVLKENATSCLSLLKWLDPSCSGGCGTPLRTHWVWFRLKYDNMPSKFIPGHLGAVRC